MNGQRTGKLVRIGVQLGIATWLVFPAMGGGVAAARAEELQVPADANRFVAEDKAAEEQREAEEQARLETEQDARDREQAKKDAEADRNDRMQDLYESGRESLDDGQYAQAAKKFQELASMNGAQIDAALYWLAYAENKQGKRDAALAAIANLKKTYPQSKWTKDADALAIEIRGGTGAKTNPDTVGDEELKLLALQGLMNSDPTRAVPMIEKVLSGSASPAVKSKALFVLAQSGSPQASEVLGRIAMGKSNPELQRKAVEYLGIFGGERSEKALAEVYNTTTDPNLKRQVLKSYMVSGNRQALFNAAKNEKNEM